MKVPPFRGAGREGNGVVRHSDKVGFSSCEVPLESDHPAGGDVDNVDDVEDVLLLSPGLARVRRRRLFLWIVLIMYLPTMWTTQQITRSFQGSLPVFFIWFLLLLFFMALSAAAKCPRCGNYFHVNGMALLYLRKCLHCQLHLTADRRKGAGRDVR